MGYYNVSPEDTETERYEMYIDEKIDDYKTDLLKKLSQVVQKSHAARFASILTDAYINGNGNEAYDLMSEFKLGEEHLYAWADKRDKFEKFFVNEPDFYEEEY